jgi:flap endonuclease-1
MGIKGLTALIAEHAPKAISVCHLSPRPRLPRAALNRGGQEHDIKTLFGRKVAIDASMSIYQFLIAVRSKDGELLTNEQGDTTRCRLAFLRRRACVKLIHATPVTSWVSSTAQYV